MMPAPIDQPPHRSSFALYGGVAFTLMTLLLPTAHARAAETLQSCYEATLDTSGDKAIRVCGEVLASGMQPGRDLAIVLNSRGLGYYKNSEADKPAEQIEENLNLAIEYFDRSIAMDPTYPFAYDNRGDAYRRKRDNAQAIADYNKAIENDPTFTSAYLGRGKTYEAMNDKARARADYQKAAAQTGTRPIDQWARGQAQDRLERLDASK